MAAFDVGAASRRKALAARTRRNGLIVIAFYSGVCLREKKRVAKPATLIEKFGSEGPRSHEETLVPIMLDYFLVAYAPAAWELCPKVGDGAIRRRVWLA